MNLVCRKMLLGSALCLFALTGWSESLFLRIEPGPHWKETTFFFIFPFTHYPQIAAWIETPEGTFVRPLMISQSAAKGTWRGNPEGGRPDALPVWYQASKSSEKDRIDATTTPTPTEGLDAQYSLSGLTPH
ncbi:MAG: DUF2271 domain-containing protein, partial [Spirochaetales bacterium]